MKKQKKHIPNLLTCLNLLSGCVACVAAFDGNFILAGYWVFVGAAFDFSDGFAARKLKSYSSVGKELDSLADMVTFGVAPGVTVFKFLELSLFQFEFTGVSYIPYIAFLLVIFSAIRLAKFNVDKRQTTSFIGLPTPANALFWMSLMVALEKHLLMSIYIPVGIILLVFVFSLLLVAEISMFSLKVNNLSWKGNSLRYILLFCVLTFLLIFGFGGIYLGVITYILLSFGKHLFGNK